jgi:hypothetical protein
MHLHGEQFDGILVLERFYVTVEYREPSYEARTAGRPEPYRWTYDLLAESALCAREAALREFYATAAESSVGWARQIVAVEVRSALSG